MDQQLFFPAQEPQPEDLTAIGQCANTNLGNRMTTVLEPGIVPSYKLYQATGAANWQLLFDPTTLKEFSVSASYPGTSGSTPLDINVGPGLAFDSANDRILISSLDSSEYDADNVILEDSLGNSICKSSGCVKVPCLANSTNYVYIAYLPQVNTSTPGGADPVNNYTIDPDTGALNYVSRLDGYQIKVVQTMSTDPDDIFIATVVTTTSITSIRMSPTFTLANASTGVTSVKINGYPCLDYVETTQTVCPSVPLVDGDTVVIIYTWSGGAATETFTVDTATEPLRAYAQSSAALSRSTVPVATGIQTYVPGMPVTVDEHIRAVSNVAYVTAKNPHAVMAEDIYDAQGRDLPSRFGAYADQPQAFQSNGIVDLVAESADRAKDPFYVNITAGVTPNVPISLPITGQTMYLTAVPYTVTNYFFSTISDGSATPVETEVISGVLSATCAFTNIIQDAGYYYIYATPYTSGVTAHSGPVFRAHKCTGSPTAGKIGDMLLNPATYGMTASMVPLALVLWDGATSFTTMTDPVTGTTGVYAIDMRKFGLIADEQTQYTRRHYTTSGAGVREIDRVDYKHNLYMGTKAITFANSTTGIATDVAGSKMYYDATAQKLLLQENGNTYGVGSGDAIKWIAQGPALVTVATGAPVVQTVIARPGKVTKVQVFSGTQPVGASLKIDIFKANATAIASVFTANKPEITPSFSPNACSSRASGGSVASVNIEITTSAPPTTGSAATQVVGQIDTAANTVSVGDRLMLYITQVGSTAPDFGGDDLLVTVFIE